MKGRTDDEIRTFFGPDPQSLTQALGSVAGGAVCRLFDPI